MSYLTALLLFVALASALVLALGFSNNRRGTVRSPAPKPAGNPAAPATPRRASSHRLPKPPPLDEDRFATSGLDRPFAFRSKFHLDPRFGEESRG